jgi:putative ABC transport system permease protein
VTYVPLEKLENATGINNPNLLLVKLNNSADKNAVVSEARSMVQSINPDLDIFDFTGVVRQNTVLLSSTWQTIMLLPLFTLASAAICLVGFMMLTVNEQHQEFAILRAIGAKPKIIVSICAIQSAIVLLSSLALGISLGLTTTLLILIKNPIVTSLTVTKICVWLLSSLLFMFIISLYPAFKLAKTSILKIMN